jgi:aspartyl-tRNA(Asn)/glutamyl-tRNA(Gln) amidotransferase subunit B
LGLPGTLPVLNGEAVRLAVRTALAVGCTVHESSIFARKNYFYPDLPKGYQISQYEEPLATEGWLDIEGAAGPRRIRIHRIHMEEDAGKNVHGVGGDSIVDLNRAGTPLVEIVSEPDLRSSSEAAAYMRTLRDVLLFLRANDGNLEEGSLRCDANVSIRPFGQKELATRCELKNLNSFKFVQRAIDSEVARQTALVDSGARIIQQTRSFDPDTGTTHALRSKEEAHDYRYFPEPDLPPLIVPKNLIEEERNHLAQLPAAMRQICIEKYGLSTQAATTLTQHPEFIAYFESVRSGFDQPTKVANYILTDVLRGASVHGLSATFSVTPAQVAEILQLVDAGVISGKQAKEVHLAVENTERMPRDIVNERNMKVVGDEGSLEPLCAEIIAKSPTQARQYRSGKTGVLGYLVGQVMRSTSGAADPKLVNQILVRLLEQI